MRKYEKHYGYRPETFGEFMAMTGLSFAIAAVVGTPIVLGDYFSHKSTIKNMLTEELGYKVKTLDNVELTTKELDDSKHYYVTLSGKLAEVIDGSNTWKETYKINEKQYFNLNEKTQMDKDSVYKIYVNTCDYLQKNIFPFIEPMSDAQQVIDYTTSVSGYNSDWLM